MPDGSSRGYNLQKSSPHKTLPNSARGLRSYTLFRYYCGYAIPANSLVQCHFRPPFFFARHPAVTLFLFSLRSLFDGTSRPGESRESVPGNLVRPAKHCQRAMKGLLDNIRARARSPPNRRRLVREATLLHLCWGVLTTAATSKLFSSQSRCPCKL